MNTFVKVRSRRRLILMLAAVLCLVACTAPSCAVAEEASPSVTDQSVVLRIGWNQMVDSLNPFIGIESVSYALYHLNYDMLTESDPVTLEPSPSLATSWTSSADLKTWTFKLRQDVTWQDGKPFTSADVVYTINLNLTDDVSNYDMYVGGIKSCKAIDDYTVKITCSSPSPRILTNLTLVPIVPAHIWSGMSSADAARKFQNSAPVIGTGPFQIVEFERDKYVRLKANTDYWGGRAKVDEIIFQMYTNNDTLSSDLKAGLIQGGNVEAAAYRSLGKDPGLKTSLSHENGFDELGFNCYDSPNSLGNPVLLDADFRKALAWAIDRDKIAEIAWEGFAEPATTIIPADFYDSSLDYHWEPTTDVAYSYDPDKCRQLLDQAGYKDSDGDGIRENKKGEPIKLRLWAASDKAEYASAAKFITGWLKDVGIDVEMQVMENGALTDRQFNYNDNGDFAPDFDLFIWGWQTGEYDPTFLLSLFTTGQIEAWSDCNFSDDEYDAMYERQDTDADAQSRLATVHEMQQVLYDECPYVPLVYPLTREVYSASWDGWTKMPATNGSIWNRHTYMNVYPVSAEETSSDGSSTSLWVTIVAVAIVAGGLGVWRVNRRRAGRSEEEGA